MLKYFQTTTILLCLCFALSLICSFAIYHFQYARVRKGQSRNVGGTPLIPVLLIAPLLLVIGFRLFGINLIYPVTFDSNVIDLVLAGLVPAVVLCFASGLIPTISGSIKSELQYWSEKPFAVMMTASGLDTKKMMRRLVTTRALVIGWMRCMPWLFGEMLIVEVIFNAPGLGLDAWTMAKQRDVQSLLETLMWLGMLYIICVFITQQVHRKLGKRLESYA